LSLIFFISILAETNRAPFDLPEAEAELVAGYNVEYSAILFVVFFLAEYTNILLMSSLFVIFFLGGYNFMCFDNCFVASIVHIIIFSIKSILLTFLFIFVRANLPRFRFDQLMNIG
jgi:NADH-quinone oxidoreductase subunit H